MLCVSSKIVFMYLFQYLCCLVANSCYKIFGPLFISCALHRCSPQHKKDPWLAGEYNSLLVDNSQYLLNFLSF